MLDFHRSIRGCLSGDQTARSARQTARSALEPGDLRSGDLPVDARKIPAYGHLGAQAAHPP